MKTTFVILFWLLTLATVNAQKINSSVPTTSWSRGFLTNTSSSSALTYLGVSGTFSGNANQFVTIGGTTSIKKDAITTNLVLKSIGTTYDTGLKIENANNSLPFLISTNSSNTSDQRLWHFFNNDVGNLDFFSVNDDGSGAQDVVKFKRNGDVAILKNLSVKGISAAILTTEVTMDVGENDTTIIAIPDLGTNITINLPGSDSSFTIPEGKILVIKKGSADVQNVILSGSTYTSSVDGAASITLTLSFSSVMLQWYGASSTWNIISSYKF